MAIQEISAGLEFVEKIKRQIRGKTLNFTPVFITEDGGRVRYAVEVTNCGEKTIVANTLGFNKRESPIRINAGRVVRQIKPQNAVEVPVRLGPGESVCIVQNAADCSCWVRGSVRDTEGNFYAEHTWVRIVTKVQSGGVNHQMEVEEETEEEREALAEVVLAMEQGRRTNRKRDRKRWKTRLKMKVHILVEKIKQFVS